MALRKSKESLGLTAEACTAKNSKIQRKLISLQHLIFQTMPQYGYMLMYQAYNYLHFLTSVVLLKKRRK